MSPRFLELEEAIEIHRDQIERYGGSHGVRDMGLLQSALAMPQAGSGDQYFHADIFEMAAAYLFHIVGNHPFVDGNKRVGAAAALTFLEVNDIKVRLTNDGLVDCVLAVALGKLSKNSLAEVFRKHARKRLTP